MDGRGCIEVNTPAGPLFGLDVRSHEPECAVGILAAIWLTVFYLPLFLFTPDSPGTRLGAAEYAKITE